MLWGLGYRVWERGVVDMGFRYPRMGIQDCGYGKKVARYGKNCRKELRVPSMGNFVGIRIWVAGGLSAAQTRRFLLLEVSAYGG